MTADILAFIAICAYLTSALLTFKPFLQSQSLRIAKLVAVAAVILHSCYIGIITYLHVGFNFSFFSTASLVSMIVSGLLLLAILSKPVESLGIFIFPITAFMLFLELFFPEQQRTLSVYNWRMNLHILSSVIAFSLLNIAAMQAILLFIQNQQLKSHPPKRYIHSMPSLQTMEALLFQMIAAGVVFLTLALGSGFIFINNLFAQHLVHKTFFSMMAWFVFSGLLFGRSRYGWRGQTAIKWTLVGFVSLLLSYFGSKFVMELLLHR